MVCGADNQIRTGDLFLTKEVLYLLSHISIVSKLAKNARILTVFSLLLIWPKVIDGILTKAVRYRLCHISASNGVALLLLRLTRSPSSIGCGGRIWTIRPSGYEPDELPDCSTPRYNYLILISHRARRSLRSAKEPRFRQPNCATPRYNY